MEWERTWEEGVLLRGGEGRRGLKEKRRYKTTSYILTLVGIFSYYCRS